MAVRKAGDSLLKHAYLAALAQEGRAPGSIVQDGDALGTALAERGAVSLGSSDLRALLHNAASPRKTASMSSAEKLGVVERYLQDSYGGMAPVLLPVQDRSGVYGASVVDGDRMVAHGLSHGRGDLAFVPAPAKGLIHIVESSPASATPGTESIATYANTVSADTARKLYAAAQDEGFGKADGVLEDWAMDRGVSAQSGPIIQRLFQGLQQKKPVPTQRTGRPAFDIVPSRGAGAYYEVLGMREGGRHMGNARLPGEPGWLGNPYVATDAGGSYTRQEATDLFGRLVEEKAQDPAWRDAFLSLKGRRVGYYKPEEEVIHLHALQDWINRNSGG